jgi:hypothetical protein
MKMIAFWETAPDKRVKEEVRTSETSVYCNEILRICLPEGFHLYSRRHENLKSHTG